MSDERAKGLESTITPERLFQAAAHNPEIAKKVGIPTGTAKKLAHEASSMPNKPAKKAKKGRK